MLKLKVLIFFHYNNIMMQLFTWPGGIKICSTLFQYCSYFVDFSILKAIHIFDDHTLKDMIQIDVQNPPFINRHSRKITKMLSLPDIILC